VFEEDGYSDEGGAGGRVVELMGEVGFFLSLFLLVKLHASEIANHHHY
jgi:hypothetical protein